MSYEIAGQLMEAPLDSLLVAVRTRICASALLVSTFLAVGGSKERHGKDQQQKIPLMLLTYLYREIRRLMLKKN
jgi:hypothetical protein